jgi:CelD/BcsL family acetyltransferase involved in cellulose biosynthesis
LLGLSIRAACDRGRRVYDFLRGEEAYKFDWADSSEVLVKACMINNTLAGRAFAAGEGLRHHARDLSRMLPAGALARVRNWAYSEARASA